MYIFLLEQIGACFCFFLETLHATSVRRIVIRPWRMIYIFFNK